MSNLFVLIFIGIGVRVRFFHVGVDFFSSRLESLQTRIFFVARRFVQFFNFFSFRFGHRNFEVFDFFFRFAEEKFVFLEKNFLVGKSTNFSFFSFSSSFVEKVSAELVEVCKASFGLKSGIAKGSAVSFSVFLSAFDARKKFANFSSKKRFFTGRYFQKLVQNRFSVVRRTFFDLIRRKIEFASRKLSKFDSPRFLSLCFLVRAQKSVLPSRLVEPPRLRTRALKLSNKTNFHRFEDFFENRTTKILIYLYRCAENTKARIPSVKSLNSR